MAEATGDRRGWSPFVEIEVDAECRVTGWDPRAEATFMATRAAALGRPIAELVPVAGGVAAWRRVLVDDEAVHVWREVGGARTFEWAHRCLYGEDGRVRGAACYGRDVTARAAEEERQGLHSELVAAICEHMNLALWAVDERGVFLFQDGRAATPAPHALIGQNILELYGRDGGDAGLRAVLAGETRHSTSEMGGKHWETWVMPVTRRRPGGAAMMGISLDISEAKRGEQALRDKLEVIERQQQVIRSMSTPIIEVWDGVLTLPILGLVDSVRTAEIMDNLLQAVVRARARYAILDMTGVEVVDTSTAGHLIGLIRAIRLLGAEGIITGIHPNIAQTMVTLGVDLSRITVHANLREALKHCFVRMARQRAPAGPGGPGPSSGG